MFNLTKTQARRRDLDEIAALDDRDLTDIGITREALEYLVEVEPAVYGRMSRMAALHGLTPADLQQDRADLTHLVQTCDHCRSKGRCESTLARVGVQAEDTGFCPNHHAYEGMARG